MMIEWLDEGVRMGALSRVSVVRYFVGKRYSISPL